MYVESLIRLAETISHFNEKGEKLVSPDFHRETEELIVAQSAFMANELKFKQAEPGPYTFGVGEMTFTIFTPDHTETSDWAALARYGNWQNAYRFNSMYGMVKAFTLAFEDLNRHQNGGTSTQEEKSEAKD